MNRSECLPCARLPEGFLNALGFSHDDCITKLELVFEARSVAKVQATFVDSPQITTDLTLGQLSELADVIKNVVCR